MLELYQANDGIIVYTDKFILYALSYFCFTFFFDTPDTERLDHDLVGNAPGP